MHAVTFHLLYVKGIKSGINSLQSLFDKSDDDNVLNLFAELMF